MHIQYFGLSSIKLTTKDATVVIDPFGKESGLTPPRGSADIIVLSDKNNPLYSATSGFSGTPFIVADPGEYDLKGVTIAGIPLATAVKKYITVYLIESEDIKILSLAHIKEFTMKQEDLEGLGEIDILMLPVGNESVMDAAHAAKTVNIVEPKIVIPTHYNVTGLKIKADSIEHFNKEMAGKTETSDKLILKRKDLASEGTKVFILDPLR